MGEQAVEVAIIGAGISGIGAAVHLRQVGIEDFVLLERAGEPGGTWRDNTYPGCACDVPTVLYSYSFAPKPDWSRAFAPQEEIRSYVLDVAAEHGVADRICCGADVLSAEWDETQQRWLIQTSAGDYAARVMVSATGPWSEPVVPDLPGLEEFEGKVFHSSRWDHEHDFDGGRVAVIGTGASAVQFVPEIQPRVEQMTVFQRTAHWVLPKVDRPLGPRAQQIFRRYPSTQRALRESLYYGTELLGVAMRKPRLLAPLQAAGRAHLRRTVPDPELRRILTPDYTLGCKRLLFSNEWYPALSQPNVDVVPHAVEAVRPNGVVGADGVERSVDTIVLGTGFTITKLPIAERIHGREGRTLEETWQGSPTGYLGSTVSGFPNLFVLLGPNIGTGHSSAIFLIETQIGYLIEGLRAMSDHDLASVDVRADVQERFNAEVQSRLTGTVWNAGGCMSYYLDANGRNSTMFPGSTFELRRRLSRFDLTDYTTRTRESEPAAV
ncbi:MAG TPA: NAD(P)/FAD-dependent oxidoreductase [Solirubrobacterales bacterium]|jgi:cyclohexanone monooxygenase